MAVNRQNIQPVNLLALTNALSQVAEAAEQTTLGKQENWKPDALELE